MKALAAIDLLGSRPARIVSARLASSPHWVNLGWLLAVSVLVSVPLFYRALFGMTVADHDVHVRFVQRGIEQGIWPAHFLFQLLIYCLSGFSDSFANLAWAALVLLTACLIAKAWLSYGLLVRNSPRLPAAPFDDACGWSHTTVLVLVTMALLLSAPLMRPWSANRIYLGQISPNIWHNPTSILCWPLVIMLFFAADAFLRSGRLWQLVAIGSLAALGVLAKPNYFLAFAPVFGLLALRRFGISWLWLLSQLTLLPTVMLLFWQLTASFDGTNAMRPECTSPGCRWPVGDSIRTPFRCHCCSRSGFPFLICASFVAPSKTVRRSSSPGRSCSRR